MDDTMSRDDFIERARLAAIPIDFEQLERDGILRREGAWYQVLDRERLPDHVLAQARAAKTGTGNVGLIKLPTSWKRTQQLYRKVTGKDIDG